MTICARTRSPQRPATLRAALTRAARQSLICCALISAPVIGASLLPIPVTYAAPELIDHDREPVKGSPAALLAEHDCWTGEAPADMVGVISGHVVVTVGGDTRLGGGRMVGKALEQIFEGANHDLVVHGFCR